MYELTLAMYRMEELIPNEENKVLFGNIVKSDGFCIDFIFYRRTFGENGDVTLIQNHGLGVGDFSIEEVIQLYRTIFLGPGRKAVYTVAMGLDGGQHEIRRCITKEYYHLTGSTVYAKKLQQAKDTAGITAVEAATPTAKTARSISFLWFADYMLPNMDRLFTFYGFSTAKYRFNQYQGKQRAPEMMVNMLLNGKEQKRKTKK
ncbi:hypothetical protein BCV72DRAFT_255864 [Rhizopus microsporus var. microsporus]|uniref:Uncharacterized protein n=1 Tax=Rhizopus microsporus var. microsporus TaxID=86635 RepID=A0A1X0R5Y9_RHIZD|nr:hypothetical protein BCV72DRAFT_255864 [Rhizopus microsporus var. microsporus]